MVLQSLSDEDLDAIEKEAGVRAGVFVAEVAPNSPAAAAGVKAGDVIFLIGETPVASAEEAVAALAAAGGEAVIAGATQSGEEYEAAAYTLRLEGMAPPAGGGG